MYKSRVLAFAAFVFLASVSNGLAQSDHGTVPNGWKTKAEETDYRKTSTYTEAIAYSKRLAAQSRGLISYSTYGSSGEGREMPLLVAAKGSAFSRSAATRQSKVVVLIQAGIHAGEIDGKDAGLALLRDIAITRTRLDQLDNAVIVFQPIYNVDGHENRSEHTRINQNGPDETGYRANATNLNLNRDYMKADAPETRAFLKLWNDWNPDIFIDCHVTNGADYRYNVTYEYAHHDEIDSGIRAWVSEHFEKVVVPNTERDGNLLMRYVEFAGREVTSGVATFIPTPRFATGYAAIRNRPGLLIETHVYKPYKSRVRGTYDLLRHTVEEAGRAKASLLSAIRKADDDTIKNGRRGTIASPFPLLLAITEKVEQVDFKGVEYKIEESDISGSKRLVYGTKPIDIKIPRYDTARIDRSVTPPTAYIIPPQYKDVISVLRAHGLKLFTRAASQEVDIESYRLSEPKWATSPFEGRVTVTAKQTLLREKRNFPAGSVVVPLDQPAAEVAIHLLEPNGPDSLLFWGFFNSIFEQKEYGEGYKIEKLAEKMLESDPVLKKEFETRLKDESFRKNPRARLNFFYERSKFYEVQRVGVYPVGRIL
ncbi:MAG: M14 family metallopeptidase [Blastocatellia bacterium]|nr:M14 family metallopeptidase [Blastocatellia bacterium]